ncbi:hypothetical protein GCM10022378_03620 [Salinicoccus jeotgali]|uniref:Uncharacterized protein n=1 Tax=Salinicoccus jeotgali TaxID=381634 RepID=A0ABP7ECT0_9STAP
MTITVKRSTNSIGMGTGLNIKADDKKIDRIYHEEEKEIELERPVAELSVSRGLSRSNTLKVADEEYIIIRSTLWRTLSLVILIVLLAVIMLLVDTFFHQAIAFLGLLLYALVAEYSFEQFRLEKAEFEAHTEF